MKYKTSGGSMSKHGENLQKKLKWVISCVIRMKKWNKYDNEDHCSS